MNNKFKSYSILEILLWFIIIISVLSLFSLIFGIFKPKLIMISSLIVLFTYGWFIQNQLKLLINKSIIFPIFILILISLFFRVDSEQYIMGGQDEGVYVNMSKYFENHGNIFPVDEFRESLPKDLKTEYDSSNLQKYIIKKKYREGNYLPGVYIKDLNTSEYVFQFYHLHPLWMAIFGDIFGEDKRQFSLLLFSLISIILFYLIIFEITSNKLYSFLGGLLLAVNPLHAYFTKFPVTEIMALCFSLAGFYFLLLYYKGFTDKKEKINRYLFLSGLIFGSLFFIRIHGFMYMPFFYVLFLVTIISNTLIRKELILYFFGIFILYALSIWYGYTYSYPYSTDIYRISFSKIFGSNWEQFIFILIAIMTIIPFLLDSLTSFKNLGITLKDIFIKYFYVLFIFILFLGIYKIYQLGFTEKYIGDTGLDTRWHIANIGFNSLFYSSLIVLIEHISFVVFLIFLYALKTYDRKNIYMNGILLFIFGFWTYGLILQYVVPYQYYYARYLLSELIPYMLLFSVIFMSTIKYQKISKVLLIFTAIYFIFLTSYQLRGTESKGAYNNLKEISKEVSKEGLLLSNAEQFSLFNLKTTFKYYFDLNIFIYNSDLLHIIDLYSKKFNNIYIYTKDKLNYDFIDEIKIFNLSIESSQNLQNKLPFIKYKVHRETFYLYKFNFKKYDQYINKKQGIVYANNNNYLRSSFNDNTWTKSSSTINGIDFNILKNKYLVLSTNGWNPNRAKLNKLNLRLMIDNKVLKFLKYSNNNYYFKLPEDTDIINNIEISSNTFNPKKMGINGDDRNLGIDIKEIKLLKDLPK